MDPGRDPCPRAATALLAAALAWGCGGAKPEAPAEAAPPAAPPTSSLPGEWAVAPPSKVEFVAVKDGDKKVPGAFPGVRGRISADPGRLGATRGWFEVDLSTLDTGLPPRDANIVGTFFDVATGTFGVARFAFDSVEPASPSLDVGGTVEALARGRLTLHGTERPLDARLTVERPDEGTLRVRTAAPFEVDGGSFGMEPQRLALVKLCGHADLSSKFPTTLDLVLHPAAAPAPVAGAPPGEGGAPPP
ncbi:YceI family protein [Myxococcota bacterium]|nr:YceI family protein [Myxococcota bacterium]